MRRLRGAALVLTAMLLAGCTGSGSESAIDSAGGAGDAGGGVSAPESAPEAPADGERQVVTTASAVLTVVDPADSAQRVSELVESVGGRVDQRSVYAESGEYGADGTSADLVVRVPAGELTGVLADLADIGEVESVSVSRSDVTATAVDLDARISALQISVDRLESLLDDAATTEALLAAEEALSERQADLESLQSQRSLLAGQVELSTLEVHLRPYGVVPAGGPDGFLEGLGTGWRALVSALSATLVILGVVLPWLVVAAVVATAVLVPLRAKRRRSAAPAATAPPAATAAGPPGPPQE